MGYPFCCSNFLTVSMLCGRSFGFVKVMALSALQLQGNGNRFSSQDECESSCMKPKGSDACQLPMVKGSCTQDKLYWGYNSQKHICEEFTYGGCLGTNNRFETRENCEQTCFYSENNDPCEQPLNIGRCNSTEQRYFFNRYSNRCEPFLYTGCGKNGNNFYSELECRNRCGARTVREYCVLPVAKGPCLGKFPRYYFDYRSGVCEEFLYGGCLGNRNQFIDRESCEKSCNNTLIQYPPYREEISTQRPYPIARIEGNDEKNKSQISATLSSLRHICNMNKDPGCGGSDNRFDTRYECEGRCVHQLAAYIRFQQELLLREQQRVVEEQNQQRRQQLEKQVIQKQNVCLQPRETGNCYNFVERFYYDQDDKKCHKFYYSGCNSNDNNFETLQECTQRCAIPMSNLDDQSNGRIQPTHSGQSFRTEDCSSAKERGPCDNDTPKWYYDSRDGVCKTFYYSGCGGNNNRFNTGRECQIKCWNSQNICVLPQVKGSCGANFSQWYYDGKTKECQEFVYSGCQGNGNRFSSKEMCLEACSSQSQSSYPSHLTAEHMHNKKQSDICHLKPEKGEGREYLEQYYYDPIQNMCKMMIYSGVGGNENRFERREQCERQCADGHKLEPAEPTDKSKRHEICLRPSDKGPCNQKMARWYYDGFTCLSFVYSGCGGNMNKFYTFDNCIGFCGGVKAKLEDEQGFSNSIQSTTPQTATQSPFAPVYLPESTPPPVPILEERPSPNVAPYDCPIDNCNQKCQFGKDNYVDERGCNRCRCYHPCHVHKCPTGQRCAVEVYRTETGNPVVQQVCRLVNKPGQCPTANTISQLIGCKSNDATTQTKRNPACGCDSICRLDADCRSTDKCCSNGCANICINLQTNAENRDNSDDSEKQTIKIKLNEQAILNCGSIPGNTREYSVAWNKDSKSILQTTAALQNRIQILTNGSLLILATQPDDNGDYTCSYANRETSQLVTKQRTLEIYDPVSILPGPRQVIATLNQPSTLECNARGIPRPIVTWWKDKKLLGTSTSRYTQNLDNYQLKISSVSISDAGVYYCQAYNDYGPIKVSDVTLLLEFEPNLHTPKIPELNDNSIYTPIRQFPVQEQQTRFEKPVEQGKFGQEYMRPGQNVQSPNNRQLNLDSRTIPIAQEPMNVKVKIANEDYRTGSSLQIDCITNQPANISWYYNNEPIEQSNHLSNMAKRNSKYTVILNPDNSLSIETLIRQHSGIYKCKASSPFSYALSEQTIEVEDQPLPPKCKDNPLYLNCQTIVNYNYCSNRTYFQYCCKSCVLSKQISIEEVYRRLT